ncbi:hypothetical protein Y1Q_0000811 [Alligator mississippiensis]|uniref:Uncharacterized protein n=1 Tax=Alligator mississippiensis TaxID=8496 RepID=A0A151MVX4_ALLMI|nr:hypothetical protein Y1Q_0000811 [Alligator mississippiensis]
MPGRRAGNPRSLPVPPLPPSWAWSRCQHPVPAEASPWHSGAEHQVLSAAPETRSVLLQPGGLISLTPQRNLDCSCPSQTIGNR